MGAGSSGAGVGLAGFDSAIGSPAKTRGIPLALRFDLQTRDNPLDEDGFYKGVHSVDQKVSLRLGITEGAVPSVPTLGNRLRRITRVSAAKAKQMADDAIRLCLSDLVAAGEVSIVSIEIDTSIKGRITAAITYENLLLRPLRSHTITKVLRN